MKSKIFKGKTSEDYRGRIFHVNNCDLSPVKRIYIVENKDISFERGWKGHKIENRWFFCSKGSVEIKVTEIENFSTKKYKVETFTLNENTLSILFVPKGFCTLIKQVKSGSRVVAMSDFFIGTSNDEDLRWSSNYFKE